MVKKIRIWIGALLVFVMLISASGCNLVKKDNSAESAEFERGPSGLVMGFVPNYPGSSYMVSEGTNEEIWVMIDLNNKGTYPEEGYFSRGFVAISGFDSNIIRFDENLKGLSGKFLQAASPVNPLGGFDTVEFRGEIVESQVTIDEYKPTILATACYPYSTKASPGVCIDPRPFDDRQEKVCYIGSQELTTQGAPVAVTKIEQEASTSKIQFKISIENVGDGDVLKPDTAGSAILDKCNPLSRDALDRKDFDRVQVKKIEIGGVNLLNGKCGPFADGTNNLVQLFEGKGFIICTMDVPQDVPSAYTTPLNIELGYNYRSSISKSIRISKLTGIS
jgi:hypothetical protein